MRPDQAPPSPARPRGPARRLVDIIYIIGLYGTRSAVAAALVALAAPVQAQKPQPLDPRCEKLLPAAAAERLTGVAPLRLVGRFQVASAGGTCNYARGDRLVLLVTVDRGGGAAAAWQRRYAGNPMHAARRPVAGLGSEAFVSLDAVYVRTGADALSLASFLDRKTRQRLVPEAALVAVAREIAGRM